MLQVGIRNSCETVILKDVKNVLQLYQNCGYTGIYICKNSSSYMSKICAFYYMYTIPWTSQVALVIKILPVNAGDVRDPGSIPGLRRSPGGGHGNPLQYSCLENPIDRGTWQATVHGVAKSWTRLKQFGLHAHYTLIKSFK